MRYRTWPVLAIAFSTLVVLIALSGYGALQRARRIYGEISTLHENHVRGERILNNVRNDIHLSGLLVRDYLLDPNPLASKSYREQLAEIRSAFPQEIGELTGMIGREDAPKLNRLRRELDAYWDSMDPVFEWTPQQKQAESSTFLRRQILPRRNAALAIAREIRDLNQTNVNRQRRDIEVKEQELPVYVWRMIGVTLLLGLLVAGASIMRINLLERRSEDQMKRMEIAEQEMRRLSQQLLETQENERRSLSRELHDEVGQMLTGLRMELRSIQELRTAPEEEFFEHVGDAKKLAEESLRAVRDLATGLRPSVLDDLGLAPAVQWQAREFSRRSGIPVTVHVDGPIESLSDKHRTCIYRVVQEALTNCARHARANDIRIKIHGHTESVSMVIEDNGVGFDAARSRGCGLGLIGMEERVKELHGKFEVFSQRNQGTVLSIEIPLAKELVS